MSLNRYKLRHLAQTKHKAARRVEKLLARPDRLLGLILIGNNLVNILASAIATIVCIRLFGDLGVAIATFGLTLVVLVFGEVTPKTLAAMFPERIAYPASWILKGLMVPFTPLVWLINSITNLLLKLLRLEHNKDDSLNSEELRTIVNEAGNLIPKRHQEMLLSILDLDKMLVEDISSSLSRHPGALISLARLKTADDYTYMHSVAVCALMIALGVVTGAHAQSKPRAVDSTVLPVWNRGSGKVEALLYLEPTGSQNVGARWNFGRSSLDAAFGLSSGDSLGLLCNGSGGSSIGGLC